MQLSASHWFAINANITNDNIYSQDKYFVIVGIIC